MTVSSVRYQFAILNTALFYLRVINSYGIISGCDNILIKLLIIYMEWNETPAYIEILLISGFRIRNDDDGEMMSDCAKSFIFISLD